MQILKILFVVALIGTADQLYAQRDWNWVFGDSVGLKFDGTTASPSPVTFATSMPIDNENCFSISDSLGSIVLYTGLLLNQLWLNIFNKYQNPVLPYQLINCHYSTTNGLIIIPSLKDSLYNIIFLTHDSIFHSIVNITRNNGQGEINPKSLIVSNSKRFTEKLTAIKHANGSDWWIISHLRESNVFYTALLSSSDNKILKQSTQAIGSYHSGYCDWIGEISVSPNGQKIALVTPAGLIEVFDFNRCTGLLFNDNTIEQAKNYSNFINPHISYYGCSFSNNGEILYVSNFHQLFQVNLTSTASIGKGEIAVIFPSNSNSHLIGQHQIGPDGRIYIASGSFNSVNQPIWDPYNMNLSVIHEPDSPGLKCDFRPHSFWLGGRRTGLGLPNLPNYNLGPLPLPPAAAGPARRLRCPGDSARLGGPPQAGLVYRWYPAEGLDDPHSANPIARPLRSTRYLLAVTDTTRECRNQNQDSVWVYVDEVPSLPADAGPDAEACPGQAVKLGLPAQAGLSYRWSPGALLSDSSAAQPIVRASRTQTLRLRVFDTARPCVQGYDSLQLHIRTPQLADAGPDIALCADRSYSDQLGSPPQAGLHYQWSPADGLDDARAAQPRVSRPGKYLLTVTQDTFCISRDSVVVTEAPCTRIMPPSAISPNGDGLNDFFFITNLPPGSALTVWNRWGRLIFHSPNYQQDWPAGRLPEGVYVWRLQTQAGEALEGTVTVLR